MSKLRYFFVVVFLFGSVAHAASSGGLGLNVGLGVPFLTQAGINFKMSDRFSFSVGYNLLDLDVGEASAKLTMPEALIHFHPFSGAFFIGAGVGKESLEVTATETIGNDKVSIEVSAMTTIIKTGWMWGADNGGFWFGLDFSYIIPSSPETTITAPGVPTNDEAYLDAVDAAEKFGEMSYPNITFARLGWLF